MVIKEFTFHFYLAMLIDKLTWHARVGLFCALKSLLKVKLNAKKFPFLTNPICFSLIFFLNVIIVHLTNAQHVLDHVLTKKSAKSYLCLKLVSAIFYESFISHQMIALQKL